MMSGARPSLQLSQGNPSSFGHLSPRSSVPQPLLSEPTRQTAGNSKNARFQRSNSEATGFKWDVLRSAVKSASDDSLQETFLEQQQALTLLREDIAHLQDTEKKLDEIEGRLTLSEKEKSKYLQQVRKAIQTRDEALLAEELSQFSEVEGPLVAIISQSLEAAIQGEKLTLDANAEIYSTRQRMSAISTEVAGVAYDEIVAKADEMLQHERHACLKRLTDRSYHWWGAFCLQFVVLVLAFVPALGPWLKVPQAVVDYAAGRDAVSPVSAAPQKRTATVAAPSEKGGSAGAASILSGNQARQAGVSAIGAALGANGKRTLQLSSTSSKPTPGTPPVAGKAPASSVQEVDIVVKGQK